MWRSCLPTVPCVRAHARAANPACSLDWAKRSSHTHLSDVVSVCLHIKSGSLVTPVDPTPSKVCQRSSIFSSFPPPSGPFKSLWHNFFATPLVRSRHCQGDANTHPHCVNFQKKKLAGCVGMMGFCVLAKGRLQKRRAWDSLNRKPGLNRSVVQ